MFLKVSGIALAALLLVYFTYGLAHRIYNTPAAGDHEFEFGFESGDLSRWEERGAVHTCCDHSLTVVESPVRRGRYAARFELRRADRNVKGSKRAEIRLKAGHMGGEYWYAFSIFLPADWADEHVPTTLAQWHGVPDKWLGEAGRSPAFRLMALDGQWQLANIWDSKRLSETPFTQNKPEGTALKPVGPLDKGQWTDWMFHIRWSYQSDGTLEVWKDGRPVFSRTGPNTYNDALAPYLKIGIYVPEWANDRTVTGVGSHTAYFDEIRVTDLPATFSGFTRAH